MSTKSLEENRQENTQENTKKNTQENINKIPKENTQKPTQNNTQNNEKQCRICLSTQDEFIELGKLISPCKCKGTMKYVHIECLNRWRLVSLRKSTYFECDQCKYKYNIQRTKLAKLLISEVFITICTILILFLMVLFTGFVVKGLILYMDGISVY